MFPNFMNVSRDNRRVKHLDFWHFIYTIYTFGQDVCQKSNLTAEEVNYIHDRISYEIKQLNSLLQLYILVINQFEGFEEIKNKFESENLIKFNIFLFSNQYMRDPDCVNEKYYFNKDALKNFIRGSFKDIIRQIKLIINNIALMLEGNNPERVNSLIFNYKFERISFYRIFPLKNYNNKSPGKFNIISFVSLLDDPLKISYLEKKFTKTFLLQFRQRVVFISLFTNIFYIIQTKICGLKQIEPLIIDLPEQYFGNFEKLSVKDLSKITPSSNRECDRIINFLIESNKKINDEIIDKSLSYCKSRNKKN